MMNRIWIIGWMILFVLGSMIAAAAAGQPAMHGADRGAGAYYDWLHQCLHGVEGDLPALTTLAERAAVQYVQHDYELTVYGDISVLHENYGRSGGMMHMQYETVADNPDAKVIVIYVLHDDALAAQVAQIQAFRRQGKMVIALARRELVHRAIAAGGEFDGVIDNHAAPHGGLFATGDGQWMIPTDTTANIVALWAWTGEFVSACTRLGKMPPMYLGYAVHGGRERQQRIGTVKFHPDTPQPIPPHRISREFLTALRKDLDTFYKAELPRIRQVAGQAVQTQRSGHAVYAFLHGHALLTQLPCTGNPGYFSQINDDWFSMRKDVTINPGDFIFCLGYDTVFQGKDWGFFAEHARQAGARLAWSLTTYHKDDIATIPHGEVLIDQHWALGDAVAAVPGYDVPICPTSGVLAESVFWMVNAEIARLGLKG